MLGLRYDTPEEYKEIVRADFDSVLQDHAANERKAAASAMVLMAQHPERTELVEAMIDMAREELEHFEQVFEILGQRGAGLGRDAPDPYAGPLRRALRKQDVNEYLLDRLILFSIIEARGCERFSMIADALEPGELKDYYRELVRCEAKHHALYLRLARTYFDDDDVQRRLDELLDLEAEIVRSLPLRPALH